MQFFYDGQIRRYIIQVIRLMSNFVVKHGDGTLQRVPVMYGDIDRQAAHLINQGSENNLNSAPRIAVYVTDLDLDRTRLGDATHVGKVHIRERSIEDGSYTSQQGQNYTVERLMPTPYKLTLKVDIWSTSTEQKLQILEQILVLFNPSLEIQTTDNFVDWTSLSVVELGDVTFSSRSIPVGTNISIDVASLSLETPIWITPPAKVKKLGVVTNIIAGVFSTVGSPETGYIDGLGTDIMGGQAYPSNPILNQKTTIGNFDIVVTEGSIRLVSNTDPGSYLAWTMILDQSPGTYQAGLSKIYLLQSDGSEIVGYISLNPLDGTFLSVNWDEDTYPSNTSIEGPARDSNSWGSFDAIIDPTTTGPSNLEIGTRYLIIEGIGGGVRDTFTTTSRIQTINTGVAFDKVNEFKLLVDDAEVSANSANRNGNFYIVADEIISAGSVVTYILNFNEDGPDAWKNSNGSDFIAEANDIIEWDGDTWHVVFSAQEHDDVIVYQTNIYTLVQYKWNGVSWVKSFDGDYRRGEWRLEL
jgi:hypothetical protein